MKVQRIDHVHFKCSNLEASTDEFEKLTGAKFMRGIDYTDPHGTAASFAPFPMALELIAATDPSKPMGAIYQDAPDGVFAISFKVESMEESIPEMEAIGFKMLMSYDFGPIKEALFDTKAALGTYVELIEYPKDMPQADDVQ